MKQDKKARKPKADIAAKAVSEPVESPKGLQTGSGTGKGRGGALSRTQRYSESPFLEGLIVKTRSKTEHIAAGRKAVVDMHTGELEDIAELRKVTTVDNEKFVKLFAAQLSVFFSLSKASMRLMEPMLDAVADHRVKNTDQIFFIYPDVRKYYQRLGQQPPSEATFYRAIAEMVTESFIAPSDRGRGWYFFNPAIFFNGDRVKFTTEIRRQKSKQEKLEDAGQQTLIFTPVIISKGEDES